MTEPTDNTELPEGGAPQDEPGKELKGLNPSELGDETRDQVMSVMLQHGTEEQQQAVLEELGAEARVGWSDVIPDVPPVLEPADNARSPAFEADAADQPQEGLSEDDGLKPREIPFFAGEFKPMANVTMVTKIIEEGQHEKLGSIMLATHDREELVTINRLLLAEIIRHQRERYRLVGEAKKGGRAIPFIAMELDEQNTVYVTEEEQNSIAVCGMYLRSCREGAGYKLFDDPEDKWTNLPKRGDAIVAPGAVNWQTTKNPVSRIRGKLGLSIPFMMPLWASGFTMEIEGPGVLEQLKLETQMLFEKVDSARETTGFVYSASAVYMNRLLSEFILEHVTKTTAGTTDVQQLKNLILLTDLENMALITAASIWPDGYNLRRECLDSKGGCGHVEESKLHPRRMLLVRDNRLSDSQFQLMTKKSGFIDHDIIRNYQNMTRPEVTRYIDLGEGLKLRMRVPTLAEYDRVASAWMERMSNRAKELIGSNASEQDRQMYLARANNIALVMAFGHWFDAFVEVSEELDAEPTVVMTRVVPKGQDAEAQYKADLEMDKMLEDMSADSELVGKIIEGVEKFINDMTLATAVITKDPCPVCRKEDTMATEGHQHPHVININAVELFFTLLHHKILAAGG